MTLWRSPGQLAEYDQTLAHGPWMLNTDIVRDALAETLSNEYGATLTPSRGLCVEVASWIWVHSRHNRPEPCDKRPPAPSPRLACLSGLVAGLVLGAGLVAAFVSIRGCV